MSTYVATTDAAGNLKCAAPIETVLQTSDVPAVKTVDLTYSASGVLGLSVTDITGNTAQDSIQLPTQTQNISAWVNGTTQSIVVGSDGKLYLANPTGAPSTHNPVNKTNDVDWFGAFNTVNDLLKYALSGNSFLATPTEARKFTVSDAPPANPNNGDSWRTTVNTAAPYAKSCSYEYDGSVWRLYQGAPTVGCASVEVVPVIAGSGVRGLPLTVGDNDLNATVSGNHVTINNDGYYRVVAQLLPGSVTRVSKDLGEHPARLSTCILINGV